MQDGNVNQMQGRRGRDCSSSSPMGEAIRNHQQQQQQQEQLPETSEIQRLDDNTVRRITAEQAISDLASIVKELMDNALDAESTTIKIRLFGQGLDIIEVSDDGNGVPVGSRPYLATRHATSKIECLDDIYSGTGLTMGFRGEALFAMACVSDSLVVATRTEDDELATKLVFGKDGRPTNTNNSIRSGDAGDPIARKVGTTVAVVKPFGNLPARRADLVRRIKQERTRIFKLVESYGIFNVGVCFRLLDINNNRENAALATSASSQKLEETISTLLGPAFLKGTTSLEICLESFFRRKESGEGGGKGKDNEKETHDSEHENDISGGGVGDDICYNWGIRGLVTVEPSLAAANEQQQRPQRRGGGSSSSSKSASGRARIVQYYSINGRVVELPKVTALLKKLWLAFSSSMGLKQKKPSAILEFTLPNNAFDINLSPDKKTVLLTQEEELLGIIKDHMTKMWSDESSNVFVDGGLSQPQQGHEKESITDVDVGDLDGDAPKDSTFGRRDGIQYEKKGESSYEYEYDEDDFKHKRRFAFVHDISKAKMQHDMAERRGTDDIETNAASGVDPRADHGTTLKQTKISPVVKARDVSTATKVSNEIGKPPPSKKAKPSPEDNDGAERSSSPTHSATEEEPSRLSSPEDRLSDLDRRKWTEIQSKFSHDNDVDNFATNNPYASAGRRRDGMVATTKVPITPEDSTMDPPPSATVTNTSEKSFTNSPSRPRLGNLQQFAFQSNTQNCSDRYTRNRNRRSSRTSVLPPDETPPPPSGDKTNDDKVNEYEVRKSSRKRKERDAIESIPLPVTDRDHRIQNDRISKELEQADANLNTPMKDKETTTDDKPSSQVVWSLFSSTKDICLNARKERLNMRKRKNDIDNVRATIRAQQRGANSLKKGDSQCSDNSGNQDSSKNEVDKKIAFDDEGKDDDSTFIRMPKSTFRNGMQVIGQFNLGFILARCSRDHLWILDQHACDEKYNYEQLCKKTVMHQQPLIRPLPLELTPSEEACVLDHMDVFEANGFRFSFDDQAPIRHRLSLMALPHSGAHEGRKAVQFGPSDVSTLCAILTEGSSYDAGSGGTGTDGNGMYGNNAVRRHAGTGTASSDRSDRLLARLPRAIAMFASRACRTSIMIGTALSHKEMNSVVQKLAKVDMPWNCPHGRPTMRHVANVLPMVLKDERRAAEHIAVPTITVVPPTQEEQVEN